MRLCDDCGAYFAAVVMEEGKMGAYPQERIPAPSWAWLDVEERGLPRSFWES